jgi:battenin
LRFFVLSSAAKSIADSFNAGDLIGAIVWANVAMGIGMRFLNTFVLMHTSVSIRIKAAIALSVAGCAGLAFGTLISFWFCLFSVVLVGCFSSLGESVILAYLKDFDPAFMGAWSSGTGMAGVGGTLMYLLMYSGIGMSNR